MHGWGLGRGSMSGVITDQMGGEGGVGWFYRRGGGRCSGSSKTGSSSMCGEDEGGGSKEVV